MSRAPGGADILALLLALVGVLGLLAAGSYLIAARLEGEPLSWAGPAGLAVLLGFTYLTLAWAFRRRRSWAPAGARLALLVLALAVLAGVRGPEATDLGALTLIFLAAGANAGALAWLFLTPAGGRLRGRTADTLRA